MRYVVLVALGVALAFPGWAWAEAGPSGQNPKVLTYEALAAALKKADKDPESQTIDVNKHKVLEHEELSSAEIKTFIAKEDSGNKVSAGHVTILLPAKGSKETDLSYVHHADAAKVSGTQIIGVRSNTTGKEVEFRIDEKHGTFTIVADDHAAVIQENPDGSFTCLGAKHPDIYHALAAIFTVPQLRNNLSPEILTVAQKALASAAKTKRRWISSKALSKVAKATVIIAGLAQTGIAIANAAKGNPTTASDTLTPVQASTDAEPEKKARKYKKKHIPHHKKKKKKKKDCCSLTLPLVHRS